MREKQKNGSRAIIFHYHLFKNAGTSVDKILSDNFGSKWTSREFSMEQEGNAEGVKAWLEEEVDAIAYSSHTARMTPPNVRGVKVLPIVFVREPLLRLYSAYQFELKQEADTFGAQLARDNDFNGYVAVRLLRRKDASARNFQAKRLSDFIPETVGHFHKRACHALRTLPFIGCVETFDQSMEMFANIARKDGFNIGLSRVHENKSIAIGGSIEDRFKYVKNKLSADVFANFLESNKSDYTVYNAILKRYTKSRPNVER